MGYIEDLVIDQYNLDEEVIKQPVLFDLYTSELIDLYVKRDILKLDVERVYARLDTDLRNLTTEGSKKPTETAIANLIINNKEYQKVQNEFGVVIGKIKELEAIKEAFLQRRDSLKLLTELYVSGYWSTVEPKTLNKIRTENIGKKLEELKTTKKEEK